MEEKIATKTALELLVQGISGSFGSVEAEIETSSNEFSELQNNIKPVSKKDILDIIGTIVPLEDDCKNFYVKALESTDLSWNVVNLQYSVNGGEWNDWNSANSLSLSEGDIVEFSGTVGTNRALGSTGDIKLGGNLLSVKFGENFPDRSGFVNLGYLFTTNSHVVDAGDLVLQNNNAPAPYCRSMFQGCSALVVPPKLPWQMDENSTYYDMFAECTSLETPPDLPSTYVPSLGYDGMFRTCSVLKTAPSFPSEVVAKSNAFHSMFVSCSTLESFPEVNIISSGSSNGLCKDMFNSCTSLRTVGIGFVEKLTGGFFCQNMFRSCSSLINAPRIVPVSGTFWYTSNQEPFNGMFAGCTSLTETLALPSYSAFGADFPAFTEMYQNCTSLVDASSVRITGYGSSNAYNYQDFGSMFEGCTNLVTGSTIDFTDAMERGSWENGGICNAMYRSCSKLSYISCILPKTVASPNPAQNNFVDWVAGVSPTGTFVKNAEADFWPTGSNGIPSGWTVVTVPEPQIDIPPFTIVNQVDGYGYLTWRAGGGLEYKRPLDNEWKPFNGRLTFTGEGDKVSFRTTSSRSTYTHWDSYSKLKFANRYGSSGSFDVYGNIASLLSPSYSNMTELSDVSIRDDRGAFSDFFRATYIRDASRLVIPFTNVGNYTFTYAFASCSYLTGAPALPATTIYSSSCYYGMFEGCTSLTKAPVLPAITLGTTSYASMFRGCSNLNEITCLATDTGSIGTLMWVDGVSSTGTFIKNPNITWGTGVNGVPSGWTVVNYQ